MDLILLKVKIKIPQADLYRSIVGLFIPFVRFIGLSFALPAHPSLVCCLSAVRFFSSWRVSLDSRVLGERVIYKGFMRGCGSLWLRAGVVYYVLVGLPGVVYILRFSVS